jgi:hypothetical protein
MQTLQKGKCPCCGKKLDITQHWYISLKKKASKGGEYVSDNLDIIHKQCYAQWQDKRHRCNRPPIQKVA